MNIPPAVWNEMQEFRNASHKKKKKILIKYQYAEFSDSFNKGKYAFYSKINFKRLFIENW